MNNFFSVPCVFIACLCLFIFSHRCLSQDTLPVTEHQTNEKPANPPPLNAEKLAWELMISPKYKRPEKTSEMKAYEEMLVRMKSGTAKLSAVIEEFNLRKFEEHSGK